MKKIILWDWDNTLVKTTEAILNAHNMVRQHFNLPLWTKEQAKEAMNYSSKDFFSLFFGDNAIKAHSLFLESYLLNVNHLYLMPGARDILKLTKRLGYINIIASNKTEFILLKEIKHFNLEKYFERIYGAGNAFQDKPSKIFALHVIKDFSPEEIYVIGDGKSDIMLANQYQKATSILINKNPRSLSLSNLSANYTFNSLSELTTFLKRNIL